MSNEFLIFERFNTKSGSYGVSNEEMWDSFKVDLTKPISITHLGDIIYDIHDLEYPIPRLGTIWIPDKKNDNSHIELEYYTPTIYNKYIVPGSITENDYTNIIKDQWDKLPMTTNLRFEKNKLLFICNKLDKFDPKFSDNVGYYYIYKIVKMVILMEEENYLHSNEMENSQVED
jgi:hypothetical protein